MRAMTTVSHHAPFIHNIQRGRFQTDRVIGIGRLCTRQTDNQTSTVNLMVTVVRFEHEVASAAHCLASFGELALNECP